jgi:xanthine dehydrogenase accessory factor
MKHWQELAYIADRVVEASRAGRPAALAIVTRIEGSAYRRPGAKLLIEPDGSVAGGVSGGCLEEDVRQVGLAVVESGRARVLHYDTGDDENKVWGLGLGCNGEVDLLVQSVGEPALGTFACLAGLLAGDTAFALATIVEDGGPGGLAVVGESGRLAATFAADPDIDAVALAALRARQSGLGRAGARQIFTEVLVPPPWLVVCGASDDAVPLVRFAAAVGFRVLVADHRRAHLTPERFPDAQKLLALRPEQPSPELPAGPGTFAVVKTHSLERDRQWVGRLIAAGAGYLGILGPRARATRILSDLGATGRDRVFAPVGLDLGADGPEQVALAVVAELLAVFSGRSPRHLREREVAVHARG